LLRSRLVLEWLLVALFGMAIAVASAHMGLTQKVDNLLLDRMSPLRSAPPNDHILIVAIDNDSLAAIGKWQWPRDVHARFLTQIKTQGPAAIAYDVLFLEPGLAGDDAALGEALAGGAPTFLPVLYEVPGANGASETLTLPIEPLRTATVGLGEVNLLFDSDGLVRRAQIETHSAGRALPHLMEAVYRAVRGRPSAAYRRRAMTDGSLIVPMAAAGTFRHISYASVLAGEVPASFLRDKIVLVGATADGMGDRFPVSAAAGSTMSGIEIQANLLNALLADRYITPVSTGLTAFLSAVPVLLLMIIFWRYRPGANLALSLLFMVMVLGLAVVVLVSAGYWFPPTAALLGLALVYPLWGWRRLEALSGFVMQQSRELRAASDDPQAMPKPSSSLDQIGQQAAELQSVIGALSGRKRFMTDVIAGLPDAVCVLDHDGRVTLANSAATALFGDDAIGVPMRDLLLRAGAGQATDGEEVTLADGRSFLLRDVRLGDRPGSITMLAETTALRELGREREEMLEFLSHDMRAPQSAILMLLSVNTVDPATQGRIGDYAKKTLRLADDFVQLARLKAVDLAQDDVNIAGVVSEAVDNAWPQAQARDVQIVSSGLDSEAFVKGDAAALFRAMANLIDNAIKYGPAGSEIACQIRADGAQVTVSISDKGPGLPPGRAKDVFARFGDRGAATLPGSGLGLAFVRTVVLRHGGDIKCDSDAARGTCFTMRFPVAAGD
jgi:CHASE2 domain-containing sensor protein/signal transduction histidine kinase